MAQKPNKIILQELKSSVKLNVALFVATLGLFFLLITCIMLKAQAYTKINTGIIILVNLILCFVLFVLHVLGMFDIKQYFVKKL